MKRTKKPECMGCVGNVPRVGERHEEPAGPGLVYSYPCIGLPIVAPDRKAKP